MSCVYGPVPSRRLGQSLGVDLIPHKVCSFDCLYCQLGRTTYQSVEPEMFVPVSEVVEAVREKLMKTTPDVITLAGSGEPTLHAGIGQVIRDLKEHTEKRIAVLTNGSLFWKPEVRSRVSEADLVMPTLTSSLEDTFRLIHRPHRELSLDRVVEGLKRLREGYRGSIALEAVLLAGINDSDREVEGLKRVIDQIAPDKIDLNTVVRPPADARAVPLDRKRLEALKLFFGENTEIVAGLPVSGATAGEERPDQEIFEMIKRRPVRSVDIASSLGMPVEDVEDAVKGLVMKGYIYGREHGGDIYYLSNEREAYHE